jgi:hypothetical protein
LRGITWAELQFVVNEDGEKVAVVIGIREYEELAESICCEKMPGLLVVASWPI